MKDREIACKNYICEGNCKIGRDGTFRRKCQTCDKYDPVKHGKPARKNLRKEKIEKFKSNIKNFF